jgi:hypothetical protein
MKCVEQGEGKLNGVNGNLAVRGIDFWRLNGRGYLKWTTNPVVTEFKETTDNSTIVRGE